MKHFFESVLSNHDLACSVITSTVIVELLSGHIEKSQRTVTPISFLLSHHVGELTLETFI